MKKFTGITIGNPSGIGPEVSIKAIQKLITRDFSFYPVLIGDVSVIKRNLDVSKTHLVLKKWTESATPEKTVVYYISPDIIKDTDFVIGKDDRFSGKASYEYFKLGWNLLEEKKIACLITAPISKASWQMAGIKFQGHTEALKSFSGEDVEMLMIAEKLKVLLVTTHIPLKKIWDVLSTDKIYNSTMKTVQFLRKFFTNTITVGVCGLNPHAGESGYLGDEEKKILAPAIKKLKDSGIHVEGIFPSDIIFKKALNENCFDLIIALYHDQALIPLKTFFFDRLVNVSVSLNWIRTSPGHGTGYDIAYKNKADPSSTIEAIILAVNLSKKTNGV